MPELIGVTSVPLPSVLKRSALWFDKFTSPYQLQLLIESNNEELKEQRTVIEYLLSEEIVFLPPINFLERMPAYGDEIRDYARRVLIDESPNKERVVEALDAIQDRFGPNDVIEAVEAMLKGDDDSEEARVFIRIMENEVQRGLTSFVEMFLFKFLPDSSRLFSTLLREEHQLETYPLYIDKLLSLHSNETRVTKAEVLHIIMSRMPIPDELVSWEQIIDFKRDPDSKRKLLALRNWANEITIQDLNKNHIEDKLDYLINEYESHLSLHRMKFRIGAIETIVCTGPDMVQKLLRLKFGDAAKSLFTIKHKKIALLEAELNNPASEIAYIVKTKEYFG